MNIFLIIVVFACLSCLISGWCSECEKVDKDTETLEDNDTAPNAF